MGIKKLLEDENRFVRWGLVITLPLSALLLAFAIFDQDPIGALSAGITVGCGILATVLTVWTGRSKSYSVWTVSGFFIVAFPSVILGFAEWYYSIGQMSGVFANNGVPCSLSKADALYFALGTLSTAGTGPLTAANDASRGVVSLQMGIDFLVTGFALAVVAARLGERRAQ